MNMKEFLGLIPARGGSKRIKYKNMYIINGKPLIYWTIKDSKESKLLDNIVVSSDNNIILNYSKNLGVETIKRPKYLSGDKVTLTDVMKYHIKEYENIVLLRPTSPIRPKDFIDKCIKIYKKGKYESLASGFINKELEWPYKSKKIDIPSHSHKGWFQNNGCLDIYSNKCIREERISKNVYKVLMEDFYRFEIDEKSDIIIIESIMKYLETSIGDN